MSSYIPGTIPSPPLGRMKRHTTTGTTSGIGTTEATHSALTVTFEVTDATTTHRAVDVEVTGLRVHTTAAPTTADICIEITHDQSAITERFGVSVPLERSGGGGATGVPELRAPANLPPGQYTARVKAKVTSPASGTLTLANTGGSKQILTVTDCGPSVN